MANDADWVSEVKRWYYASVQSAVPVAVPPETEPAALGYEAAHPALEARRWPDSGRADFSDT